MNMNSKPFFAYRHNGRIFSQNLILIIFSHYYEYVKEKACMLESLCC